MAVLITGGRGTLGRLLAPRLRDAGYEVIVSTRSDRAAADPSRVRTLDLAKQSVDTAVFAGIDVVVHAASNPARSQTVDVKGTGHLLEAAASIALPHIVYLSIVGVDGHPFPYYKAKAAAEQLVEQSPVPHTILRATQFHEFLDRIFSTGPVITAFSGIDFQVIDGGVVADRLVEIVVAGPSGRVNDIGGPQIEVMGEMAGQWKVATGSRKPVIPIPTVGKTSRAFKERRHHTPNRAEGTPTWHDWLRTRYGS